MACASVRGGALCSVLLAAPSTTDPCTRLSSRVKLVHVSSAPIVRPLSKRMCRIVVMASSPSKPDELVDKVRESIATAQEVCTGNETSEECVVAWDEVEELSAAAADKRSKTSSSGYTDPLEKYCAENPETDECRVYED